jgi:hypothetical protein
MKANTLSTSVGFLSSIKTETIPNQNNQKILIQIDDNEEEEEEEKRQKPSILTKNSQQ